jgi:hypothetical protein
MKIRILQCIVVSLLISSASGQEPPAAGDKKADGRGQTGGAPAVAEAGPPGTTQEICPQDTVPVGWVVTSTRACSTCCGIPRVVQMRTVTKIDGLPPGYTLEICNGQATPAGWVVVSTRACSTCCGASFVVQLPTIKKYEGLPPGTTFEICPYQVTPPGYKVIRTRACTGCCGSTMLVNIETIQKL